jgi:signal peptidase II
MNPARRKWLLLAVMIVVVLAADQLTKSLVVSNLIPGETVRLVPALSPFFQLTLSQNSGAAFGFLPQSGDLFLVIAIIVVIAMMVFYPRVPPEAVLTQVAIGLVCGGALGNATDRIFRGAVVDFIHYQIPGLISNVSNVADHAIVAGVIVIFIDSWRSDREKEKRDI